MRQSVIRRVALASEEKRSVDGALACSKLSKPNGVHMETVYIETSVVSLAAARTSSSPAVAVLQQQCRRWFAEQAKLYALVTSDFVIAEASDGDGDAAAARLSLLAEVPLLIPDERVEEIAAAMVSRSLIPATARLDALHVATAAAAGVEFLLTCNCRHIANAHILPRVYDLLAEFSLPRLLICTPAEFLGDPDDAI